MKTLLNRLMDAAHRFTAMDFAIFKICLLCMGILLGAYFSSFFHAYIVIVWIVFVVTWLSMLFLVGRYMKK